MYCVLTSSQELLWLVLTGVVVVSELLLLSSDLGEYFNSI